MSQTLKVNNFNSLNIVARTVLSDGVAANVSTLPVQNSTDFSGGPILIGAPGNETAELATATGPTDDTNIPLSPASKLAHNNGEPVLQLVGSKIKVYSAQDVAGTGEQPPDSNFSEINGSPFNIDGSKTYTVVTDPDGAVGVWYKYTYYNSTTDTETPLADSIASQAGQVHYVSLDAIRRAAGFQGSPNVTDAIIAEKRDSAEREINGALLPVYNFPLPQPTNPIIAQIARNIAAGELKYEMYQSTSMNMAKAGSAMASQARSGGGAYTSLKDLVLRDVVLTDATFNEQTIDEGHGFGGYPNSSTPTLDSADDSGFGPQFTIDQEY